MVIAILWDVWTLKNQDFLRINDKMNQKSTCVGPNRSKMYLQRAHEVRKRIALFQSPERRFFLASWPKMRYNTREGRGRSETFEKLLQNSTYIACARSARAWCLTHKKTHLENLLNKIENVLPSCKEIKSVL